MEFKHIFSILLLIGLINAANNLCSLDNLIQNNYIVLTYIGPIAFLDILIIVLLILFYHFKNTHDPNLNFTLKREIKEFIITIVIFVLTPVIFYVSCQFLYSFHSFFNINSDYLTFTNDKLLQIEHDITSMLDSSLSEQIRSIKESAYVSSNIFMNQFTGKGLSVMGACIAINFIGGFKVVLSNCMLAFGTITLSPYAYYNAYNQLLTFYFSTAKSYLNLFAGQRLLISLIFNGGLTLLLSAAFILRFIPQLRKGGNLLYVSAYALYTLFPFIYAIFLSFYDISDICSDLDLPKIYSFNCNSSLSLIKIGFLLPFGILLPNLVMAFIITFISSVNKLTEFIE